MWILYDLVIHLYGDAISIASLFNAKARMWVQGRGNLFANIRRQVGQLDSWTIGQKKEDLPTVQLSNRPTVAWFHCASLGEFEQGRPVIEAFRKAHPDWRIVLTFFSPSGYEVRKNYEGADFIYYLPLDTPGNASKFIGLINPSLVFFVKYEFWFRYLDVLYKNKIPVYVISAIFRPDQHFFQWYGGWALKQLKKVTGFFVQDEASAELLRAKGLEQVVVSGDTRFDRVAAIAENAKSFPLVEKFAGGSPVFLAGSTWPADEELIMKLIEEVGDKVKFIIAPHEVGAERVRALKDKVLGHWSLVFGQHSAVSVQRSDTKRLSADSGTWNLEPGTWNLEPGTWNLEPGTILFSELNDSNAESSSVLIIDGIGYLSHLYQYATIAYIGGGFGVGIHNILEAATFGKPVIFGPNYQKFREAVELIEEGGAFSINSTQQLNNSTIELLTNPDLLSKTSQISSSYVQRKKGATGIISSFTFPPSSPSSSR
jgi:3-deoxy-D-manno-octulosonic-acid transferase